MGLSRADAMSIFSVALMMRLHYYENTMNAEQGARLLQDFEQESPELYDVDLPAETIRFCEDRGWLRVEWTDGTRTAWSEIEMLPNGMLLPPDHTFDGSCCRR